MFDLQKIWHEMGLANKAITLAIFGMALASVAVTVERIITLSKSARISREFAARAQPLISGWDARALVDVAKRHRGSALAKLFDAIASKYLEMCDRSARGAPSIELVKNEAARQQEAIGAEMRRGMSVLATIGSITPFVGLLGTVIGIIAAFQKIGAAGAGGIGTVSTAIGEALIETALGLFVAIPAVVAFNYLTARVTGVEAALGRSAGQLIDEMEFRHVEAVDRDSGVSTREAA